jgi:hypothetical protein
MIRWPKLTRPNGPADVHKHDAAEMRAEEVAEPPSEFAKIMIPCKPRRVCVRDPHLSFGTPP